MKNININRSDCLVPSIMLGGWPVVRVNRQEFAKLMIVDCFAARKVTKELKPKLVFDINGHGLSMAQTDSKYRKALKEADYIHVDGQSLVLASNLLSQTPLIERIATTDFFHDAALVSQKKDLRMYFLGASEKINTTAVDRIRRLYPELLISGHRHGYFRKEEEWSICKEIVSCGTDILWIGLGKPKEQLFCIRNKERLNGIGWLITCGGLFDFLGGRNKRAPKWMQIAGFEWLHRLIQDPRRFFWRYLTTNIHATYLLCLRREM